MKIEIEHVSKKIKDALVLDDVCMTLESGNIYGFQGVNGSGKTMLMRAVSGLMYPTSGTISIDGKVLGTGWHGSSSCWPGHRPSRLVRVSVLTHRHRAAG